MLMLCLDGGPCSAAAKDVLNSKAADRKAKRSLGEKMGRDAWQTVNWLASEASLALSDPDEWFDPLPKMMDRVAKEFGVQRPSRALPTRRELEFIGNVHGKFNEVDSRIRNRRIDMSENAALGAGAQWTGGTPDTIEFGDTFFNKTKREQVTLLYHEATRITGIPAHLQSVFTNVAVFFVYKHGIKKP